MDASVIPVNTMAIVQISTMTRTSACVTALIRGRLAIHVCDAIRCNITGRFSNARVRVFEQMCVFVRLCLHTCALENGDRTCSFTCLCVHARKHVSVRTHMCVSVHVCLCVCVYVCMCV